MIILQMDFSGIRVDGSGNGLFHFSTESKVLDLLQQVDPAEKIFIIFPAARQIPDSGIVPLGRSIVQQLTQAVAYLPDLNQRALDIAEKVLSNFPDRRLWIGFDDFLYRDIPEENKYYGLPYSLAVRYPRHGIDGLVHGWACVKFSNYQHAKSVITVHLNQRPTMCVFRDGSPVDMTTGYSPVDGLPGEFSSGTIDPSLPVMMAKNGKSTGEIRWMLAEESGWQTIPDPHQIQIRSMLKAIGSLAASAGELDHLVFFGEPADSNKTLAQALCAQLIPFGLAQPETVLPENHGIMALTSPESALKAYWMPETIQVIYQELIRLSSRS